MKSVTKKDRILRELWKDKDNLSDYAIAEKVGCSHVLVWRTRRDHMIYRPKVRKSRNGVLRRMPGKQRSSPQRETIESQVMALVESLENWRDGSRSGAAFMRRKRAQIARAFDSLKLTFG